MALSTTYSKLGYALDSIFYGIWAILFAAIIFSYNHLALHLSIATLGLVLWTFLEYIIHRFVLHHIEPFKASHDAHHSSPSTLIATSTYASALIILLVVFLPTLLFGILPAISLTTGVVLGYFTYGIWHYGCHSWKITNRIFLRSKMDHAIHHRYFNENYGVTTKFWDKVFRTTY